MWRFTAFSKSHADRIYTNVRENRQEQYVYQYTHRHKQSTESRGEKENFDSLIQYYIVV